MEGRLSSTLQEMLWRDAPYAYVVLAVVVETGFAEVLLER